MTELEAMIDAARRASELVLRIRAEGFDVEMKGEDDPVTRADKEANALICGALAERFPGHGVVGEESVPKDPAELASILAQDRVFFVDPVDGTREFTEGRPDWCVMIGLAVRGRAELGVVAVPNEGKLFWGSAAGESFVEERGAAPRRLRVADVAEPEAARAVVSRSHPSPATQAVLDRLGITRVVPCGSVGVKAVRVVEGAADLYVHASRGTKLWDACAPDAVLRGAGGELVGIGGDRVDYRGPLGVPGGLVATGSALLPAVLEAVRAVSGQSRS